MNTHRKTDLSLWTAVGLLASGVALSVAGFCVPPVGHISDSVLWYFSQTLIYAGSVFGVGAYMKRRFEDMRRELRSDETDRKP